MENEFINLEQPSRQESNVGRKEGSVVESASEKNQEKNAKKLKQPLQTAVVKSESSIQSDNREVVDLQVKQIEAVLADGLDDYYKKLSIIDQKKFKETGEQAAQEINTLLQKAIVKINEIIDVIKKWLGSVPGLNKFFVEQSAKIKADKVLIVGRKHE